MKPLQLLVMIGSIAWSGLWFTSDQQGQRLMRRGHYQAAAETFCDPLRQGVAWFRAGDFAAAERAFARLTTAEAEFNRGNCLVMLGEYAAAVRHYTQALERRPGWDDAEVNRQIALARAKRMEQQGGDMGDQKLGADEITFDKKKNAGGQDTNVHGDQPLSDAQMQALWLRRIQTKPADFLKAKFAYQLATRGDQEDSK